MYRSMVKCARLVWFLVVLALTLAFFNYPRSWWQELTSQVAPLWTPLLIVGIYFQLRGFTRAPFSFVGIALFVLQVLCIVKVAQIEGTYLYAPPKSYPALTYSNPIRILFVDVLASAHTIQTAQVSGVVEAENPDLVIVTRNADQVVLPHPHDPYPFTLVSSVDSARKVEIFSKTSLSAPLKSEYGFGALPAVLGVFQTSDGVPFQLGAFDLLPSQESFNSSRLTSRRLASALKFSSEPRIVVGAFRAPVTSQMVDMYASQLKLRSVFCNAGIAKTLGLIRASIPFERNLNIFTARSIDVEGVKEFADDDRGYGAILFTARIPSR